jgi:hypothetical protein
MNVGLERRGVRLRAALSLTFVNKRTNVEHAPSTTDNRMTLVARADA